MKKILISLAIFLLAINAASADEATTTDPLPLPDPVTVSLDIQTATGTLFSSNVQVTACSATSSTPATVNGYCALQQTGLSQSWSSWGDDLFLNSIGEYANDYAAGKSWLWFSDLDFGQTSLYKHELAPNEKFLVSYGTFPLKTSVSTTTPPVGATTTISVSEFGFDSNWNGVWSRAASSTVSINGDLFLANNGTLDFAASTTEPINVWALKEGFIKSSVTVLSPYYLSASTTSTTTATTTTATSTENTGGGGGGLINAQNTIDINSAIAFLVSKQKSEGSFGSSLYTDWAAIAISHTNNPDAIRKVTSYLIANRDGLSSATDYERRAMALMSLGVNPYSGTPENYIKKITDTYDGTQIGDPSLINDDIFALFPLLKSGLSGNDDIIKGIVKNIISKQSGNGSWENSVDLTAAGIQALSQFFSLDGVTGAISKAEEYMRSAQRNDGGWGSSFSTSWALQAISALGQSESAWIKNGNSPDNYLYSFQQEDGGIEPASSYEGTRIWATAYAIPAAQGKTWFHLLSSFSKPYDFVASAPALIVATESATTATSSIPVGTTTQKTAVSASIAKKDVKKTFASAAPIAQTIQSTTTDNTAIVPDSPAPKFEMPTSSGIAAAASTKTSAPITKYIAVAMIAVILGYGFARTKKF